MTKKEAWGKKNVGGGGSLARGGTIRERGGVAHGGEWKRVGPFGRKTGINLRWGKPQTRQNELS